MAPATVALKPLPTVIPLLLTNARSLCRNASHYVVVAEPRVLYFCSEEGTRGCWRRAPQYWMDPTLNDLEERLDPALFRVSRSAIVNLSAVAEVNRCPADPAR